MAMTTSGQVGAVASLDLLAPDFRVDSPAVRAAAAHHWYAPTALGPAVLHYADCVALLRDRRFRQAGMDHLTAQGIADGPLAEMWRATILNVEGADHTRLRRLVSSAFTRSVVERLRPRMRSLVHHLVDTFAPLGACEFMSAFADHYPPRVMFDLLGIPEPDQDRFLQLGKDLALMLSFSVAEHRERIETALADLNEVTDRLCAERRLHLGEDLLSGLVAAADGDDRLTTQELRSMVATMVVAGQDSTRNQLGMALWTFTHHPTQWTLLAHRPDLAERAVEEIMRVSPTVPVIWRVANDDVAHRELTIPAGTRLWLMIGAAHREPATFGEDSFDILLDRPAQLSFGHGVHYCLGAVLARAEMTEALPILASRLRGLELAGDPVFRPELSGFVGPERLPIRFDVRLGVDTVRDPC
ncbi:MAG TPA: cytochrome P450 [Acidimicrobiales bacterium]|nr:cytochrome P450 [Acidimicrobiales bacterium]